MNACRDEVLLAGQDTREIEVEGRVKIKDALCR